MDALWNRIQNFWKGDKSASTYFSPSDTLEGCSQDDTCEVIEALQDFDWQTTQVKIFHPYKAPYNLMFGMTTIPISELVEIDSTYFDKITERKAVMENHPDSVLAATDEARCSVDELYRWYTRHYLPCRFPSMFRLDSKNGDHPMHLQNLVDGETYALKPPAEPVDALKILGSLVDEDLLFMLPSADGDGYSLAAFVNCFANGPSSLRRLNMKLRDIHSEVPGYANHLSLRMDKWFENLKAGTVVMRSNWTVTDDNRMFVPDGHTPFSKMVTSEHNLDMSKIYIRTERQTLRRLPTSGAIIFSLRTYLYPITEIKAAGYGETLSQAIDGLQNGNSPGIYEYKKCNIWDEAVKEYLRN